MGSATGCRAGRVLEVRFWRTLQDNVSLWSCKGIQGLGSLGRGPVRISVPGEAPRQVGVPGSGAGVGT